MCLAVAHAVAGSDSGGPGATATAAASGSGGRQALLVSLQEMAALVRRHIAAILIVVAIAAWAGYSLHRAPTQYQDSGTVVFTAPTSTDYPNPFASLSDTLIDAGGIIALYAMSPQAQQQIRQEGGAGSYDVELVNSYNLEYPDFSDPYVTVTATAVGPAQAQRTFNLVNRLLATELTVQQASVRPVDRIGIRPVGVTGPLSQQGSSKRVFAGLLVLTVVAVFSVACVLDRRLTGVGRHRLRGGRRAFEWLREQLARINRRLLSSRSQFE